MEVNLKDTKKKYHFDYDISSDTFKLDEGITGSIKDKLKVTGVIERLLDNKALIDLTLTGTLIYPCSRCLEDVEEEVTYQFEDEIEMNSDYIVNVDEYINDCLFINEPIKVLCKEDCKGLCPICGTNLNISTCDCEEEEDIDPRFEQLKNLF